DRDSLESELLELRLMAHAIGNGLRKLASGDVHQQIEAPLPHNFEGMRKDYNRGLASIASATEDIASHANELRAQSHELREVLQQVAEGGAHQEDMVKNAIAVLGGALDTSHGQSSHVDHIA